METSVSLVAEIPDSLHKELQEFLDTQRDWDFDQLLTASISLFLRQNRHEVKRMNLNSAPGWTQPELKRSGENTSQDESIYAIKKRNKPTFILD